MSSQFKHRLIGTIVLVALLVIILPDIIDGHKEAVKEQFSTIPFAPKPADEKPLMIDLSKPSNDAQQQTGQMASSTANSSAVAPTQSPSTVTAQSAAEPNNSAPQSQAFTGNGWIIQLATLKSADSTQRLIEKLRNAGYQAHSYPQEPVDGKLNRIFVGPELSKDAMEKKIAKLKQLTGLKGFVRRFDPLDQ
ncbi:SPOR domain-containing protein [Celerinatantimonas diazotrophica]|uniref:DedD protein n=1 Tax=Celerinatantimonas diazotrophica TaxID=412034 RepID=A0A4R1JA36_9GAMM|nr:SPOR domain-containing protein [Celerinatantimonas diazotrophica]TCK47468.1 DedD protein [Celerinatantimonas diazotrophica]CAG9296914.1 Cell division protein DedD [Celerinatantimonas diazotrophica]